VTRSTSASRSLLAPSTRYDSQNYPHESRKSHYLLRPYVSREVVAHAAVADDGLVVHPCDLDAGKGCMTGIVYFAKYRRPEICNFDCRTSAVPAAN